MGSLNFRAGQCLAVVLFACVLTAQACGGDERVLLVDVRTDFAPSIEFSKITIEVDAEIQRYTPTSSADFFAGARVGRFESVAERIDVRASSRRLETG